MAFADSDLLRKHEISDEPRSKVESLLAHRLFDRFESRYQVAFARVRQNRLHLFCYPWVVGVVAVPDDPRAACGFDIYAATRDV